MARLPQVPSLPPSPVWLAKQVPEKVRGLAFWPLMVMAGFVVFALLGLTIQEFEVALLGGIVAGPILAYAAVGPPFTREEWRTAMAKVPRPSPEKRPFLFFPAAFIAAALLYFGLGFAITSTPLDEDTLTLLALGVSIPAAVAIAYLMYGFPHPKHHLPSMRRALGARVPPEKRPLLFVPLGLLVAAPFYFLLGYAFTEVLDADIAVLLALAIGLAVGFAVAYKLVGIPHPRMLEERMRALPGAVPPRARPVAFAAFVLVGGSLLAVLMGGIVAAFDFFEGETALDLAFPLFLLAGWLLAFPLAGALFGYPIPERPLREYVPRLTAEQRPAALLPLTVVLGLVLTFALGTLLGLVPLADLEDAALSAAIAFPLALLIALRVLRVSVREVDPRGLARVPERAKPLALVGVWLFVGTLAFTLVGQVLTGFAEAVLVSYALGLAVAVVLVDRPTMHPGSRRARKARAKEIEARLRRELGLAAEEPEPEAAGPGRLRLRRGKA